MKRGGNTGNFQQCFNDDIKVYDPSLYFSENKVTTRRHELNSQPGIIELHLIMSMKKKHDQPAAPEVDLG